MQCLVFITVVGFLKDGDKICPAVVQIPVILCVHRVNLQAHYLKIFSRDPAGLTDVFHIGHLWALTGQQQDFLQTGSCNGLHLPLDLFWVQPGAVYLIMAVKAAINAVVLAVIRNVKRCEQVDGIAEVPAGLKLCPLRHFLQIRHGRR